MGNFINYEFNLKVLMKNFEQGNDFFRNTKFTKNKPKKFSWDSVEGLDKIKE